jgi:RES domain-containing protein
MVEYEAPEDLAKREIALDVLPSERGKQETRTQRIGDEWLDGGESILLVVPSMIVPIDRNALINHRRTDADGSGL